MPPLVIQLMQDHRAAILAREAAQMAEQGRAWLGVEQALTAQTDALALEMANSRTLTMGQLARNRRYTDLRRQVNRELGRYVDYLEPRIVAGQRNMVADAISHSVATVNAVAVEAGVNVQFNRMSSEAVEGMVGLAGDGSPLREILDDATSGAGDMLGQQLINGTALGKNPLAVARTALRLGLGRSFSRLQLISRTEQLRVLRQTTLESYRRSEVVIGYRRLSARDTDVCAACLMADGRVYDLEGFDEHPAGRCAAVPILRGIPPTQYEDGQTWFAKQPESTQRTILGRGRFDLWNSGQASLDDMVTRVDNPTWGGSLQTTTLKDLMG